MEPQPFPITSQDETLMKKAVEIIEANMDNSEFTVEELCLSLGISRSVFFNKVKSFTGLAPIDFVRDIKMKRAAQLLASGEYMVKEVAFMVGFSDIKYFAKYFKFKYGVTPHEYKAGKMQ
jgi:AraC-like DNA-binding protein